MYPKTDFLTEDNLKLEDKGGVPSRCLKLQQTAVIGALYWCLIHSFTDFLKLNKMLTKYSSFQWEKQHFDGHFCHSVREIPFSYNC